VHAKKLKKVRKTPDNGNYLGQCPVVGRLYSKAALMAAAADADPVTRLVLGWLAAKRSGNTRAAYARDIGIVPLRRASQAPSWFAWCQAERVHPVTGVTGLHVARYARRLEADGLSPASVARKLAAVSGWYAWLVQRGHIDTSPAAGIARPRLSPRDPEDLRALGNFSVLGNPMDTGHPGNPGNPRYLENPGNPRNAGASGDPGTLRRQAAVALTRHQARELVYAADRARGPQRARTSALVAVLLLTGARVSEVIAADVEDLGTEQGRPVLWVTRRDGRRQPLPLPGPAATRLDAYLAARPGVGSPRVGSPRAEPGNAGRADARRVGRRRVLFATGTGRRLFAADVWRIVRRLAAQAGLPEELVAHLGPEAMRHSFARLYLDAGGSLADLQGVLGHADQRTTRRYVTVRQVPSDLVAAYLVRPGPQRA